MMWCTFRGPPTVRSKRGGRCRTLSPKMTDTADRTLLCLERMRTGVLIPARPALIRVEASRLFRSRQHRLRLTSRRRHPGRLRARDPGGTRPGGRRGRQTSGVWAEMPWAQRRGLLSPCNGPTSGSGDARRREALHGRRQRKDAPRHTRLRRPRRPHGVTAGTCMRSRVDFPARGTAARVGRGRSAPLLSSGSSRRCSSSSRSSRWQSPVDAH